MKLGADDVNWLALANRTLTDEQFDNADERMTQLVDGEYDGYDRGVG